MFDEFRSATASDFEAVWQLYADVCAHQEQDAYSPQWTFGVYPTEVDIRGYLEAGEMWLGVVGERPLGVYALVPHEDPEYDIVTWPTEVAYDEVAVIHMLAVHPDARGKHLGAELVAHAIERARELGKRVIHLDVVPGNLAASRIYLAAGFEFVGTYEIFYEDTGVMPFDMYEYDL